MSRQYKVGGSEDQSSGPQTPSPIPDQSALEKLGTLRGADCIWLPFGEGGGSV